MRKIDDDIIRLPLDCISYKVAIDEGLSLEKVDKAADLYRAFLQANRDNPGIRLAPSKEIDIYWHHHILDTSKYIIDCRALFGRYFHHFPYSGLRGMQDQTEQEQRYEKSMQIINAYHP